MPVSTPPVLVDAIEALRAALDAIAATAAEKRLAMEATDLDVSCSGDLATMSAALVQAQEGRRKLEQKLGESYQEIEVDLRCPGGNVTLRAPWTLTLVAFYALANVQVALAETRLHTLLKQLVDKGGLTVLERIGQAELKLPEGGRRGR